MRKDRQQYNRRLAEEYFDKHRVVNHELIRGERPRLEVLRWQEPGTVICMIDYLLKDDCLVVIGDLGDGIYRWHAPGVTLEWISGLNLDYFHGKCRASELGDSLNAWEWDGREARKYIFERFRDDRDCKGYKKYLDSSFPSVIDNKEEFYAALYHEDCYDIFGSDWQEWLPEVGRLYPLRTRLHLIGLKMAFAEYGT